jgi:hypothetical protein
MSDSHNRWTKLDSALEWANEENCEKLLFAGDLVRKQGVKHLAKFRGQVIYVWGNNQLEKKKVRREADSFANIHIAGKAYDEEIGGIKVFMMHRPPKVMEKANSGHYDLCVHGHTHRYREGKLGATKVVNPGELAAVETGESSFAMVELPSLKVERLML